MDVTDQHQGRAALEKAFDEIKTLKEQLHRENLALREQIDQMSMFEEIVGSSPALQAVLSRVARVAPADSKQFRGNQGRWDSSTVNGNERPSGSSRALVDGTGDEFLSSARLAHDENRGIGRSNPGET